MADNIRTTCPYCGVGCGVLVFKDEKGETVIKGDPDHPANFGRLCSKGLALGDTLSQENRLRRPEINHQAATWEQASDLVATRFKETIERYGPDSVAFYVSGQLLSEDYYVANKLMKGFIGSANIDTNSRLCMSSSVAGHKRAFGSDTVPQTYEDLEKSDLVVLVGSNLAWCHPILFQRLKAAKKKRGTKVVVIDPRKTATCEIADLHLAIAPGSDVMLFNGLLSYLDQNGAKDISYVTAFVQGAEDTLQASSVDVLSVAKACDVPVADVRIFYDLFLKTDRTLSVYSQGVNQSSQGTDKVNSIINCHLFTGRIGREGCGPLSVTGQPNAMGGREVGGLANMLAAHMDFTPDGIDRVSRFWQAPNMATKPGKKALDMFEAIHEGQIKAVWIMATNPCVSLPNAARVCEALEKCDFVVVSDCVDQTDTMNYADVVLPAAAWGERNGTVTNTERRISRQRAFCDPVGAALPDWKIMTQVARKMGFEEAFPYESSYDVFCEHVALSAFENQGERDFDLSGWLNVSQAEFDAIAPTQWPVGHRAQDRFFGDGRFYTPTGKANMVPVYLKSPAHAVSADYPYVLNTGRIRDQWHTMTRTGLSPRLSTHHGEPYLEVNPETALQEGVRDGALVEVTSNWGRAILRVKISEAIKRGEVFMPMHWSDENSAEAVVGRLVNPVCDPHSGQPESKHTPVSLKPFAADWHALLIVREKLEPSGFAYWTRSPAHGCYIYDVAGVGDPSDWDDYAGVLLGQGEMLVMSDERRGARRYAVLRDDKPVGVMIMARTPESIPSRNWITGLFAQEELDAQDRLSLLSAKPAGKMVEKGAIVCSCFNIGLLDIQRAIVHDDLMSVEAIGVALKAGTNCGSCQSEIQQILDKIQRNDQKQKVA